MMQRVTEQNNAKQATVATKASVLSACAHESSVCANTAAYSDTAYAVSFFAFYFYSYYFYFLRRQRKQAIAA